MPNTRLDDTEVVELTDLFQEQLDISEAPGEVGIAAAVRVINSLAAASGDPEAALDWAASLLE